MYGNSIQGYGQGTTLREPEERNNEITVVQQLDLRIKWLKDEVTKLEGVKERLGESGLLNCRIDDLRIATNY